MRRPFVATVAVAAVLCVSAVAYANAATHHKMHHVTSHHATRAAYAMAPHPTMMPPAYMAAPVSDPCDANLNVVTVESCEKISVNGF